MNELEFNAVEAGMGVLKQEISKLEAENRQLRGRLEVYVEFIDTWKDVLLSNMTEADFKESLKY